MTDTERSMITLQELLRSTSVTVDQYKEAIYFALQQIHPRSMNPRKNLTVMLA